MSVLYSNFKDCQVLSNPKLDLKSNLIMDLIMDLSRDFSLDLRFNLIPNLKEDPKVNLATYA